MKQPLLALVGLFALLASTPQLARAQDAPPAQDQETRKRLTPDEVVAMLDSKLSLSDDQKAKITPIIAERQQKMKDLATDSSGRRMKKGRQMKSIFEESDKKIMALLNDDQKQKYSEIQQQMREHAKQRMHDRARSD